MTKQVLIIEDTESLSQALLYVLTAELPEYTFIAAENGLEGLNILRKTKVDLTITDLDMPVMDGYEFLSHARKAFPDMPTFVMTAGDKSVEKKVLAFGVSRLFYKPFNFVEFSNAVSDALLYIPAPNPDLALTNL